MLGPCPHLQSVALQSLVRKFGEPFQEELRNKSVACSSCNTTTHDIWACLHCDQFSCGRSLNKHSLHHYEQSDKAHAVCVNIYSRQVWCYGCDDEIVEDIDHNVDNDRNRAVTGASTNVLLLKELRLMLDPSRPPEQQEGEDAPSDEMNDSEEDDSELDEDERSQRKNIRTQRGLCGLTNLGNTCYLNAALQALSNLRPLNKFFRKYALLYVPRQSDKGDGKRSGIVQHFAELMQLMWGGKQRTLAPNQIVRDIFQLNSQFRGYGQQDSQEFLRCLLSALHEELKMELPLRPDEPMAPPSVTPLLDNSSNSSSSSSLSSLQRKSKTGKKPSSGLGNESPTDSANGRGNGQQQAQQPKPPQKQVVSVISDIFEGTILSEVTCLSCKKVSAKVDEVYELSVSMPTKKQRQKIATEKGSTTPTSSMSSTAGSSKEGTRGTGLLTTISGWFTGSNKDKRGTVAAAQSEAGAGEWGGEGGTLPPLGPAASPVRGSPPSPSSPPGRASSSASSSLFGRADKNKAVTLQDCLHAFCSTEELTGDDKYRCENCKSVNEATKRLTIVKLPEVLVVHIKRFRYDSLFGSKLSNHVAFPIEELDMRPFCQKNTKSTSFKYDLVSMVQHHGMLNGGHYTAMCKNFLTNKWYEYDDSQVHPTTREEVARAEAYMLFYKKRPATTTTRLRKRIVQQIRDLQQEPKNVLSQYWYSKFLSLCDPGPINNYEFLCHHRGVDLQRFAAYASEEDPTGVQILKQRTREIPRSAYELLAATYGGGPAVKELSECVACVEEQKAVRRQREYEKKMIQESDRTFIDQGDCWFIIDARWLNQWREFALEADSRAARPGPISNERLLLPNGQVKPGLQKARDYRGVNRRVWEIFHKCYGGGPIIPRTQLDIYSDQPSNYKLEEAGSEGED
eukprot:tig00000403_g364.t1